MAHNDEAPTPLPYASPRPAASRPARLREVGCGSSLVGSLLFGIALAWAALRYTFVYDGAPSLAGGALVAVLGIVIGGVFGALLVPAIVLSGYWIIWRLAGRP